MRVVVLHEEERLHAKVQVVGCQDGLYRVSGCLNSLGLVSNRGVQGQRMYAWLSCPGLFILFDGCSTQKTVSTRHSRLERDTKISEIYRSVNSKAAILSSGWYCRTDSTTFLINFVLGCRSERLRWKCRRITQRVLSCVGKVLHYWRFKKRLKLTWSTYLRMRESEALYRDQCSCTS